MNWKIFLKKKCYVKTKNMIMFCRQTSVQFPNKIMKTKLQCFIFAFCVVITLKEMYFITLYRDYSNGKITLLSMNDGDVW